MTPTTSLLAVLPHLAALPRLPLPSLNHLALGAATTAAGTLTGYLAYRGGRALVRARKLAAAAAQLAKTEQGARAPVHRRRGPGPKSPKAKGQVKTKAMTRAKAKMARAASTPPPKREASPDPMAMEVDETFEPESSVAHSTDVAMDVDQTFGEAFPDEILAELWSAPETPVVGSRLVAMDVDMEVGETFFGQTFFGQTSVAESSAGESSVAEPSAAQSPVAESPFAEPSPAQPSVAVPATHPAAHTTLAPAPGAAPDRDSAPVSSRPTNEDTDTAPPTSVLQPKPRTRRTRPTIAHPMLTRAATANSRATTSPPHLALLSLTPTSPERPPLLGSDFGIPPPRSHNPRGPRILMDTSRPNLPSSGPMAPPSRRCRARTAGPVDPDKENCPPVDYPHEDNVVGFHFAAETRATLRTAALEPRVLAALAM